MIKLFLILVIFLNYVSAWWQNGHMIAAQIAELVLQQNHPEIFDIANKMVLAMNGLDSNLNDNFVTSSVWADDIKDKAMNFWESWHYYDRPVNPDGIYLQQDPIEAESNACTALERAVDEIMNSDGTKITAQKTIMIRYIIHIVGDVHQPLHSSNLFNETYNDSIGDMGGNLLNIITIDGVKENLHAYWDQGAEVFQTQDFNPIPRPLSQQSKQYLIQWSQKLMESYSIESFGDLVNDLDIYNWTKESWEFAKNTTYPLMFQTNQLDEQYHKNAQELCKSRVTLAGYRLANLLVDILQGYVEEISFNNQNIIENSYLEEQVKEKYQSIFTYRKKLVE